jgi:hypothetical protein
LGRYLANWFSNNFNFIEVFMASSVIQENGTVVDTTVFQDTNQLPADSVCGKVQAAQDLLAAEEAATVEGA